jgi:hypothetical protein
MATPPGILQILNVTWFLVGRYNNRNGCGAISSRPLAPAPKFTLQPARLPATRDDISPHDCPPFFGALSPVWQHIESLVVVMAMVLGLRLDS